MLFFAPAVGLDDFLGAEDGLVALGFADFALVEGDLSFYWSWQRIFAEYNFKKGWQALRHTEGILHPMVPHAQAQNHLNFWDNEPPRHVGQIRISSPAGSGLTIT